MYEILFFDNENDLNRFISHQKDDEYEVKEFNVSHLYDIDGKLKKSICFMREDCVEGWFNNLSLTTKEDFYNDTINHIKEKFEENSLEPSFKYESSSNNLFKIITCKFYQCGSSEESGVYFELFYDINFNLINS